MDNLPLDVNFSDLTPEQIENLKTIIKAKKIKENKSWNSRIEEVITNIAQECSDYDWKHKKDASWYKRVDNYLGFWVVVINTLTGTSIFATLNSTKDEEDLNNIHLTTGFIIWFSAMLAGIQKYFGFKDKMDFHHKSAKEWTQLYMKIQKELYFYRCDRSDAKKFLEEVINQYIHILMNSPNISQRTIRHAKKEGKDRENTAGIVNIEDLEKKLFNENNNHKKRKSSLNNQYSIDSNDYSNNSSSDSSNSSTESANSNKILSFVTTPFKPIISGVNHLTRINQKPSIENNVISAMDINMKASSDNEMPSDSDDEENLRQIQMTIRKSIQQKKINLTNTVVEI